MTVDIKLHKETAEVLIVFNVQLFFYTCEWGETWDYDRGFDICWWKIFFQNSCHHAIISSDDFFFKSQRKCAFGWPFVPTLYSISPQNQTHQRQRDKNFEYLQRNRHKTWKITKIILINSPNKSKRNLHFIFFLPTKCNISTKSNRKSKHKRP